MGAKRCPSSRNTTLGPSSTWMSAIWPRGMYCPLGVFTVISRTASMPERYGSSHRTTRSKRFSPSYTCVAVCSADGGLDDGLHVARVEAEARARAPVGGDLHDRLAHRLERPEVLDAADRRQDVDDLAGVLLVALDVGTEDLDRVLPFDAADGLLDVVADHLREVEDDPGERVGELLGQRVGELLFRQPAPPLGERPERREELDVLEAGHVGPVVGPTELGDDGEHLRGSAGSGRCTAPDDGGQPAEDRAHAPDVLRQTARGRSTWGGWRGSRSFLPRASA